ncbi:MAG: 50S ribosomal protein L35 [Chlamydiae bacterium RIFCSPHIGHO2_12_FULL_49_11]|nr:MAG: 50S ribosomal protein L35 [Chlamydiae bacterium RIFCSPHIGHO2_12_FULL_49_11]
MIKAKSNKALKKRFKITATGKLLRKKQGRRHLLAKKSTKHKRDLGKTVQVGDNLASKYKRMISGF